MSADKIEAWRDLIRQLDGDGAEPQTEAGRIVHGLLEEVERLRAENKRLKTALLKAATAQKPSMSTKLSEALRE
ncbi:hypothetical protein P9314_05480 [Paenibacillus validus]|uniref:Ni2+-binding GTPase n=1 Tax=Paenibacillus validus TaxID=44253 RepID=A0A7X3CUG0_9BACL|nr:MULTISPECIES: hypothetical protein [Paenibacillus]MED4600160.1 hypothetical protein [Paenibacillus validus]MED4607668.1 hypothetical protein [Paenibacillus validus]MUG72671.1 hypothetical protein [Paenibacillus validus]